jgi:hypothetical protein
VWNEVSPKAAPQANTTNDITIVLSISRILFAVFANAVTLTVQFSATPASINGVQPSIGSNAQNEPKMKFVQVLFVERGLYILKLQGLFHLETCD